jgi:hypothetical protein
VAAGVGFIGNGGSIVIDSSAPASAPASVPSIGGEIVNFARGDVIDLTTVSYPNLRSVLTSWQPLASGGVLSVIANDGVNSWTAAQFTLGGTYRSGEFQAGYDAADGTDITVARTSSATG